MESNGSNPPPKEIGIVHNFWPHPPIVFKHDSKWPCSKCKINACKKCAPRACIMHKCMHLYAFLTIYGMHLIESILHIILYLSIALYASGLPRMHTSNICMHLYMHTCIRLHAHACILKNKLFVLWAYGVSFSTAKEFWDNAFNFMKQNKVIHA